MNLTINQIVGAYESSPGGLETLDQLARAYGYEREIVQTILQAHSVLYRTTQDALGMGVESAGDETPAPDISDERFAMIKEAVYGIGMNEGVQPGVRLKALLYQWDEKKGRNDVKRVAADMASANITQINNYVLRLEAAKAAKRSGGKVEKVEKPVIDVVPVAVTPTPMPVQEFSI